MGSDPYAQNERLRAFIQGVFGADANINWKNINGAKGAEFREFVHGAQAQTEADRDRAVAALEKIEDLRREWLDAGGVADEATVAFFNALDLVLSTAGVPHA